MKLFKHEGFWWIGCTVNGHTYLISKVGRVGDCISPSSPRFMLRETL